MKRYRAAIYVDYWAEDGRGAAKQLEETLSSIPNAFTDGVSEMPHGSAISLDEEPKGS